MGSHRPDFIRDEILADLLETTARRMPHKTALVDGLQSLTYAELDQAASLAASRLIEAGIGPGQIVGLWLPRGANLLVMQAAIAKTGAAWLPFDADTPLARIQTCLEDAQSPGLVSCRDAAGQLAALPFPTWLAEDLLLPATAPLRQRGQVLPTDPAYVIYTSGSTGKPKGIEISQGAICHFLRSENSLLGVRESDRVYQGFSVAFDMSFEEIWISYLVGATLWIAPRAVATDPEALPQALAVNGVTVLHAVPTLLALFEQDVPSLRIINLGGEMCPQALVARWTREGRQVFNSYGPTEATVSASMTVLRSGEPVTIGSPLPNYGLLVLDTGSGDANALRLAPRGEAGELCITGPGVARGYLGRAELTAEKFIANPWATSAAHARMYRTGDLARIDENGQVQCLGRTDDQVKIRGFRVELGEIEAVLMRQSGIGTAAVVLRSGEGIEQLVAFYVADSGQATGQTALRAALAASLPPYMVPGHFEALAQMPRLISGKIDRNALRALPLAIAAPAGGDMPGTPAEAALFDALRVLFPGQTIRRDADFFSDLGGHSLFAARLASALRAMPGYAHVTVRDIYQHRSVSGIAAAIAESQPQAAAAPATQPPAVRIAAWRRWRCGAAQAIAAPALMTLRMAQWLAPFFTYHFYTGDPGDSIALAVTASAGVFLLMTLLAFGISAAGVRLVAGNLKPGSYPLWGLTYFRWWLGDRLAEAAPTYLLAGSSLYVHWLRSLGARVGHDALIGSITLRLPSLLAIGDGASIGNAVNLENAHVQGGRLHLGRIDIGAGAFVGSYAVLEGDTALGTDAHLDGQSALTAGMRIPAGRCWTGSPARDAGAFDRAAQPPRPAVSRRRLAMETGFFGVGALLVALLFFLPVFPAFMLIDWLGEPGRFGWLQSENVPTQLARYFLLALPASALLIVCTVLLSVGIRWTVLPRLKPGSWPVHSIVYCRKWLVNQIQEASLHVLHGVYATVYSGLWYRLLGAKVGRDAEISSALGVVPDMLTLGDETFIADAVMLGDEHIDGGWMTMQPTVISRRSFVGNGAYVPDGTVLPENTLIGVHSRAPSNRQMQPGDTWLGTPPINLPAREGTTGFPESL
ncbi:MAG TPA: Pls/PosA family non-ribosomal peptide synthetase, partial [Noviherbaspirillum sp.]